MRAYYIEPIWNVTWVKDYLSLHVQHIGSQMSHKLGVTVEPQVCWQRLISGQGEMFNHQSAHYRVTNAFLSVARWAGLGWTVGHKSPCL